MVVNRMAPEVHTCSPVVMSPLADAVCLIYSYELDVARTVGVDTSKTLPEAANTAQHTSW